MTAWLTNDKAIAARLRGADRRLDQAREAAKALPLAEKLEAFRRAKRAHEAEYNVIGASLGAAP